MEELKLIILIQESEDTARRELCRAIAESAVTGFDAEIRDGDEKNIPECNSEYVLCLSDAIIGEELPRTLCFHVDEHPERGWAVAKILDAHGVPFQSNKFVYPNAWIQFRRKLGKKDQRPFPFRFYRKEAYMKIQPVEDKKQVYFYEQLARQMKQAGQKLHRSSERIINIGGYTPRNPSKNGRILIMCHEDDFQEIKKACVKQMPTVEYVNLWDLDSERVMDAICRKNQMKQFTDTVFCWPDVRSEQIIHYLDSSPNKQSTYHVYHKDARQLIRMDK